MANTDWWGQPTRPTAEQQFHAQKAAAIQQQWEVEARAIEAQRQRKKSSAYLLFSVAAAAALGGLGSLVLPDLFPNARDPVRHCRRLWLRRHTPTDAQHLNVRAVFASHVRKKLRQKI
jgi:hypothetical protein